MTQINYYNFKFINRKESLSLFFNALLADFELKQKQLSWQKLLTLVGKFVAKAINLIN